MSRRSAFRAWPFVAMQLISFALVLVGLTQQARTLCAVLTTATSDTYRKNEEANGAIIMKHEIKKLQNGLQEDFKEHHDQDHGSGHHLQSSTKTSITHNKQEEETAMTEDAPPPPPLANDKKKYRGWVMMHTLKAGGNSVEKMLNMVGYDEHQRGNDNSLYQYGRNGGYVYFEDAAVDNRLWYDQYMAQWEDGNDDYFSALPHDEFFKIGLVREPCDYMVSIWAYSRQGKHGFLTGQCAGIESEQNFTRFLHESIMPYQFGWLSYRVALQLGAAGKENIGALECPSKANAATLSRIEAQVANFNATSEAADCWVRTENMLNDLRRCLKLYVSKRGGETSMAIHNLLSDALDKAPHENSGRHLRFWQCSSYYSEQDANAVWEREGKFAEQFGYSGCCKGLIDDPHPI